MNVRAKFKMTAITRTTGDPDHASIKLNAVSPDSEDNKSWSKWTPSGEITMFITNPEAVAQFELGADYYVDFTKASPPGSTA